MLSTPLKLTPARAVTVAILSAGLLGPIACNRDSENATVVLYCSVDQEFAREVIAAFEAESGIRVAVKYDTEASKSTGLAASIAAQRANPRADVFWSSEIFNTIVLARQGLLESYDSPSAAGIPARFKDGENRWTAFGLRARVLAYHTELFPKDALPKTWSGLADLPPQVSLALADPEFGTTRGHVAAMFALWGEAKAADHLRALKARGLRIVPGNGPAVRLTGRGEVWACLTDTDDVFAAQQRGEPVDMVYPDFGDGGTLLIPNTVAIIRGGPNPETARALTDFLVSARVERMLAESVSGNFPVRDDLLRALGMERPAQSPLSFESIADAMPEAIRQAIAILRGG